MRYGPLLTYPQACPAGQLWFLRPDPHEGPEFERLCRDGLLRRVVADIHVPADLADTVLLRAQACAQALPVPLRERVLVVSHRSAVWLHTGRHPGQTQVPEILEVAWPGSHGGAVPAPLSVRTRTTDPRHVVRIGPVWVTSRARTAVDLLRDDEGNVLDPVRVCAALEVDPAVLMRHVREITGLPGIDRLRRRLTLERPFPSAAATPDPMVRADGTTGAVGPSDCR